MKGKCAADVNELNEKLGPGRGTWYFLGYKSNCISTTTKNSYKISQCQIAITEGVKEEESK